MARSAAMLHEHGVSIEESVAIVAAGNESLQNPEKLGNAIKSIASRLSGVMYSTKEGRAEINKTAKALRDLANVDIFSDKDKGEIKDVFQIFDELSKVWDNLNDKDKFALGEALAGKQQANFLSAVMGNWERALQFRDDYQNGLTVGSAMKENERYIESVAGAMTRFSENLKKTFLTIVTPEQFRGVVSSLADGAQSTGQWVENLKQSGDLSKTLLIGFISLKSVIRALAGGSLGLFNGFSGSIVKMSQATTGFAGSLGLARNGAIALKGALGLLNGLLTGALFYVGYKGIKSTIDYFRRYEIAVERTTEKVENLRQKKEELEQNKSTAKADLESLSGEYQTIIEKKKKTKEEQEKINSILKEVQAKYPDLVEVDAEGNPIKFLIDDIGTYISKLEEAIKKQEKLYDREKKELGRQASNANRGKSGNFDDLDEIEKAKYSYRHVTNKNAIKNSNLKIKQKILNQRERNLKDNEASLTKEYFSSFEKQDVDYRKNYQNALKDADKYYENLAKIREGKKTTLISDDRLFGELDENQIVLAKKNIEELTGLLDFSSVSQDYENVLTNAIKNVVKSGEELPNSIKAIIDARREFDENYDYSSYSEAVKQNIDEASSFLNVEKEVLATALDTHQAYILNQGVMDAYLRQRGKTINSTDEHAQKIKEEFEAIEELGAALIESTNWGEDGIFSKDRLSDLLENLDALPTAYKDLINLLSKDGLNNFEIGAIASLDMAFKDVELANDDMFLTVLQDKITTVLGNDSFSVKAKLKVEGLYEGDVTLEELESIIPKDRTISNIVNGYVKGLEDNLIKEIVDVLSIEDLTNILGSNKIEPEMLVNPNVKVAPGVKEKIFESMSGEELKKLLPSGTVVEVDAEGNVNIKEGETAVDPALKAAVVNAVKKETSGTSVEVTANTTVKQGETSVVGGKKKEFDGGTLAQTITTKTDGSEDKIPGKIQGVINSQAKPEASVAVKEDSTYNSSAVQGSINNITGKTVRINIEKTITETTSSSGSTTTNSKSNKETGDTFSTEETNTPALLNETQPTTVSESASPIARASKKKPSAPKSILVGNTEYLKYGIALQTTLLNTIEKLNNELSLLDTKMEHAYGKKKIEMLEQQIKLTKQLQKEQDKLIGKLKTEQAELKKVLGNQGFKFDKDGNITNYVDMLKKYEKEADGDKKEAQKKKLEEIKKALDRYLDITFNELPDAVEEWGDLSNAIKDAYKEQLETTKDIEDKITEVYKKQVEERKKLIDDELDKRLKALDQQRKAYNKAREEQDFQRDVSKQQDVMSELQEKIALASRDTSTAGRAKLKELMKQYQQEQERLEEMMQDDTDKKINDMFDKQEELMQEAADKEKDKLDEKYSDENLKKLVQEAIKSGLFVGIDGNVKDLQKVLLEFEDKFGDGMTAVGQIIKNELVTNLEIAKKSMKEMNEILKELQLPNMFKSNSRSVGASPYNIDTSVLVPKAISMRDFDTKLRNMVTKVIDNPVINFNQPLISVDGNVTKDSLPELNTLIREAEKRITSNLVNALS